MTIPPQKPTVSYIFANTRENRSGRSFMERSNSVQGSPLMDQNFSPLLWGEQSWLPLLSPPVLITLGFSSARGLMPNQRPWNIADIRTKRDCAPECCSRHRPGHLREKRPRIRSSHSTSLISPIRLSRTLRMTASRNGPLERWILLA